MTESSDDATVVTFNRSREHAQAQALPRVAPPERADFNALSASLSSDIPFPGEEGGSAGASASGPSGSAGASVAVPAGPHSQVPGSASDDGAAFRQTRLAVTAGLVVLLLVVWVWQRRGAARR